MSKLWLIVLLVNSVTYACHSVCLYILSDHKRGKVFSVLGSAIFWILCMVLCVFATTHRNSNFYWFITNFDVILMLTLFALTSSGSLAKSIFMVCTYGIYFYFTMIPCELTLRLLPNPWRFIPYAPIRIIMYVFLIVYWVRRGRYIFEKATGRIQNRRWIPLAAFSVIALFSITFVMTRLLMLNKDEGFWEYAISFCMLFVSTGAYVLIIRLMAILNDEHENHMILEREKLLLTELDAQKTFVEQAKQNRHDLCHHNRLLIEFLNKEDVDGLRAYLAEYDNSIDKQSLDSFCENIVANAMIRHTAHYARNADICFSCEAHFPAIISISNTELCVLLGNLFENALKSCNNYKEFYKNAQSSSQNCVQSAAQKTVQNTEKKPFINIKAKIRNNKLYLSVRNSVAGTVLFKNEIPKSTKQDGGVGIRSILTILQSYEGMASFEQQGDEFISQVILPV